jgi:hypothetical protein
MPVIYFIKLQFICKYYAFVVMFDKLIFESFVNKGGYREKNWCSIKNYYFNKFIFYLNG